MIFNIIARIVLDSVPSAVALRPFLSSPEPQRTNQILSRNLVELSVTVDEGVEEELLSFLLCFPARGNSAHYALDHQRSFRASLQVPTHSSLNSECSHILRPNPPQLLLPFYLLRHHISQRIAHSNPLRRTRSGEHDFVHHTYRLEYFVPQVRLAPHLLVRHVK
jgi:hypothetical protein